MPQFLTMGDINDLPPGAMKVSIQNVQEFYATTIKNWKPESELWALVHGPNALGFVAACSGFHLNTFFRRQLKLRQHGYFSTFLPNTVLPLMITFGFHTFVRFQIPTISCSKNLLIIPLLFTASIRLNPAYSLM